MTEPRSRRAVLAGGAQVALLALAGCVGDDRTLGHDVEVYNSSDEDVTVRLRVLDADGNRLIRRQYVLADGEAREGTDSFDGDPETLEVQVDDGPERRHDWPDPDCKDQGRNSAGTVDLYVEDDGLRVEGGCDTVYV